MAKANDSGYPCVFPNSSDPPRFYFKFSWRGEVYRSELFDKADNAYTAYKRRFLQVVKESFRD